MVICYPDGFYRRGNIQVMCDKYSRKLVETLDKLVKEVKDRIKCYKGSCGKNTVRKYISLFNYLLLDAKQGLVQGFYRGGSFPYISSQILFNLILILVLTSPLKLAITNLLGMLEEQKQQLLHRHRFYLYIVVILQLK